MKTGAILAIFSLIAVLAVWGPLDSDAPPTEATKRDAPSSPTENTIDYAALLKKSSSPEPVDLKGIFSPPPPMPVKRQDLQVIGCGDIRDARSLLIDRLVSSGDTPAVDLYWPPDDLVYTNLKLGHTIALLDWTYSVVGIKSNAVTLSREGRDYTVRIRRTNSTIAKPTAQSVPNDDGDSQQTFPKR